MQKQNRNTLINKGLTDSQFQQKSSIVAQPTFELHGHRGARGLFPENSLEGFIETVKMGVKVLELDVIVSKDKKIVVSHEAYLNPEISTLPDGTYLQSEAEGLQYNLYQMTVEEIQSYDCGSKPHQRFPKQKKIKTYKPTLQQVVEVVLAIDATVKFNIEIKSAIASDYLYHPSPMAFARLLWKEIQTLGIEQQVYVQSFDVRCLQAFRQLTSVVPLSLLVENDLSVAENLALLGFKPYAYSPHFSLLHKADVEKLHKEGIHIFTWTVNEPADMQRMIDLQVDAIITDYPDRLLALSSLSR